MNITKAENIEEYIILAPLDDTGQDIVSST